jgi:hypothetical protein
LSLTEQKKTADTEWCGNPEFEYEHHRIIGISKDQLALGIQNQ